MDLHRIISETIDEMARRPKGPDRRYQMSFEDDEFELDSNMLADAKSTADRIHARWRYDQDFDDSYYGDDPSQAVKRYFGPRGILSQHPKYIKEIVRNLIEMGFGKKEENLKEARNDIKFARENSIADQNPQMALEEPEPTDSDKERAIIRHFNDLNPWNIEEARNKPRLDNPNQFNVDFSHELDLDEMRYATNSAFNIEGYAYLHGWSGTALEKVKKYYSGASSIAQRSPKILRKIVELVDRLTREREKRSIKEARRPPDKPDQSMQIKLEYSPLNIFDKEGAARAAQIIYVGIVSHKDDPHTPAISELVKQHYGLSRNQKPEKIRLTIQLVKELLAGERAYRVF